MRNFYIEQSSGRYTVNGDGRGLGQRPVQRGALRPNYCGSIVCATRLAIRLLTTVNAWYATRSPPARPPPRSTTTSRSSTSGTATTTTATATSTSRTATSTTSSRPRRRGRGDRRRRAGRPTPSGATAGTPSSPRHGPDGPARNKLGGVQIGGSQLLGRRLHRRAGERRRRRLRARVRPRPRPARRVRHVAATPAAPRTRPASGRSCRSGSYGSDGTPADGIGTGRSR